MRSWAVVKACSLAEEAMRSKTTVGGPCLSACAVIALSGKRGLKGRRLEQHSRVFVYVRWGCVWRCAAQAPGLSTPRLPCLQSKYWWLCFLPLSGPTRLAGETQVCSLFKAAELRVTQAGGRHSLSSLWLDTQLSLDTLHDVKLHIFTPQITECYQPFKLNVGYNIALNMYSVFLYLLYAAYNL